MNPTLIVLCGVAQLVILYNQSRSTEALLGGVAAVTFLAIFAYSRHRWDAHMDMFLAMTGPGGLGMLVGAMVAGGDCHDTGWSGFLWMSLGMALAAIPLCWFQSRCLLEARHQGRGLQAVFLDWIGMQAGMLIGHLPGTLIPVSDPRAVWLHHAIMLVAMSLGMLAAALTQSRGTLSEKVQSELSEPRP